MGVSDATKEVQIKDKLCITVEEASAYSGIPISEIKAMLKQSDCPFRLYPPKKGRPVLIKRQVFEEYILSSNFNE